MSHFSRIRTQMVSREFLLGALEDLGYEYACGKLEVRGFGGNRTEVEIRVRTKSPSYDIGFRRVGDRYEVVADWWGINDTTEKEFVERVVQRYVYRAARATLEREQGFSVVEEKVDDVGRIHLLLRRME